MIKRLVVTLSIALTCMPALVLAAEIEEPALPAGLESLEDAADSPPQPKEPTADSGPYDDLDLAGFVDIRGGTRLQSDDRVDHRTTLAELRLRGELQRDWELTQISLKADLVLDALEDDQTPDLDAGTGWFQLREALVTLLPSDQFKLDVGRRVLVWGTGDLIFVNDLFPKDFNSFFLGRSIEYLRVPSDMVRLTASHENTIAELVYAPKFEPDTSLDPERFSFYTPPGNPEGMVEEQDEDEIHARIAHRWGAWEGALYGYYGLWKRPVGLTEDNQRYYPKLNVLGASVRGPVAGGIFNLEFGRYDSPDGTSNQSSAPPDQLRFMAGFEKEIGNDLTLGLQYYQESIVDYEQYLSRPAQQQKIADEHYRLGTVRLTQFLLNRDLRLSLIVFHSPTDKDQYFRAVAQYRVDDHYLVTAGANLFDGRDRDTFYGQLQDNSNVFLALRRYY